MNSPLQGFFLFKFAKVEPGQHSLVVPLGAKAKLNLKNETLLNLPEGIYTVKMIDISGASWEHKVKK